jgi:hypothetical protein
MRFDRAAVAKRQRDPIRLIAADRTLQNHPTTSSLVPTLRVVVNRTQSVRSLVP